jgi:hypothetical protein
VDFSTLTLYSLSFSPTTPLLLSTSTLRPSKASDALCAHSGPLPPSGPTSLYGPLPPAPSTCPTALCHLYSPLSFSSTLRPFYGPLSPLRSTVLFTVLCLLFNSLPPVRISQYAESPGNTWHNRPGE